MQIIIPVSPSSETQASQLVDQMVKLGGLKDRKIVIMSAQGSSRVAGDLAAKLTDEAEATVQLVTLKIDSGSSNAMFSAIAETINAAGGKEPFLYMAPGSSPAKEGWAEKIEDAYKRERRPYLGSVVPGDANGNDSYMRSTAVYPHDLYNRSTLIRFLHSVPHSEYMQYEIMPEAGQTDLIGDSDTAVVTIPPPRLRGGSPQGEPAAVASPDDGVHTAPGADPGPADDTEPAKGAPKLPLDISAAQAAIPPVVPGSEDGVHTEAVIPSKEEKPVDGSAPSTDAPSAPAAQTFYEAREEAAERTTEEPAKDEVRPAVFDPQHYPEDRIETTTEPAPVVEAKPKTQQSKTSAKKHRR